MQEVLKHSTKSVLLPSVAAGPIGASFGGGGGAQCTINRNAVCAIHFVLPLLWRFLCMPRASFLGALVASECQRITRHVLHCYCVLLASGT